MVAVVITQSFVIEQAMAQALRHLEVEALIRGKRVAVKPNDTWASAEDTTAVTQSDTLRAVLQYVQRCGPSELVVTGGAGAAETAEVFRLAGLTDVVRREGASFFGHNRPPFTAVALEYQPEADVHGLQASVMANPRVLEYDTLIALNQLTVHQTATVTLALKNIAMSYLGADYYSHPRLTQHHRHWFFDDMHSFIAAMARRFPIQLAVTVGHPAMIGTGPLGRHAVEAGLVIASTDPLAADVAGAKLLGFQVQAVRHLWEAGRLGIGETEIEKTGFPALSLQDAIGAFATTTYGKPLKR
jgi:uncharacterized protein (DUF362 family)